MDKSMNTKELSELIGKSALLTTELSLTVPVTIADVRQAYGRTDFLIKPVNGSGERWVNSERVTIQSV